MSTTFGRWHHGPPHIFAPNTLYMVTASTVNKAHLFRRTERLHLLQNALFDVTAAYGWSLQAWAIFSNHYHFIARSPDDAARLKHLIQRLHSQTSRAINQLDGIRNRRVWFQYWDSCLTTEASYMARLRYVHNNAVKHRLVVHAADYPFCSAGWYAAQEQIPPYFKDDAEPWSSGEMPDDFMPVG